MTAVRISIGKLDVPATGKATKQKLRQQHFPPLPLRPHRERAGGTRELRGSAVMLNLRGGEELKTQSRKRGYADAGRGSSPKRSASPTKTHHNNHHKRPAIGSTIKRASSISWLMSFRIRMICNING
jgi:hypothetical protein